MAFAVEFATKARTRSVYRALFLVGLAWGMLTGTGWAAGAELQLLNVSYDPTRELYADYNAHFSRQYTQTSGTPLKILQSHGGSGKQARSVIDGLRADVVTLALASDIDALAQRKLVRPDWQKQLPGDSSPYTSTIVFLVRAGNPKQIRDWPDLIRPGVKVITPNPKTSGGARWNLLAAWGYITIGKGGTDTEATAFLTELFRRVPVLDSGARGSTTTFVQKQIGDVYLAWENEAKLALSEYADRKLEIVYPSISILAQPSVAVVAANVDKRGPTVRAAAEQYLRGLYDEAGQEIVARHGYRPSQPAALARHRAEYPEIRLFTIQDVAGGWGPAQRRFFAENGVYDQLTRP